MSTATANLDHTQGVRANLPQFALLLLVNAFVGATIGVERTVLPLLGEAEFGLRKATVITSFIVAFGITKAFTNLFAGRLADAIGRRRVLLAGWLLGVPVPLIVIWAPSWSWVVAANVLLGINQGLCWTLTLLMKIDLGGARRRGFSAGINETIGYGCVALAGLAATTIGTATGSLRPYPFYIAIGAAVLGLVTTALSVRDTRGHVDREHDGAAPPAWSRIFAMVSLRDRSLFAAVQAGFVRNLADGMAWGLLMLLFADVVGRGGAGTLQWILVGCFAIGQVLAGAWSDRVGRKPFIVTGMLAIGASLFAIAATRGFWPWVGGVAMLGLGGSLMYPTVVATLSDQTGPVWRATGLGVYRFWRDMGYAAGALSSGLIADAFGRRVAVQSVAVVCIVSALVAAAWLRDPRRAT